MARSNQPSAASRDPRSRHAASRTRSSEIPADSRRPVIAIPPYPNSECGGPVRWPKTASDPTASTKTT